MIDFKSHIHARQDAWIARRRDFHRHPELAFKELRTAGIVAEQLTQLGLEVQTGIGQTGVIGVLDGGSDGRTVLVRADMDALPIHEENQTDYVSQNPGVMHACGHDGHTTIALAVAELLSEYREIVARSVCFLHREIGRVRPRSRMVLAIRCRTARHLEQKFLRLATLIDGPVWQRKFCQITARAGRGVLCHP
jgi:hypothetical protein